MFRKENLRKELRAIYAQNNLNDFVNDAINKISECSEFLHAKFVCAYAPQENVEIPFIKQLMEKYPKKDWLFPSIVDDEIIFSRIENWNELTPGKFGILEPRIKRHSFYDQNSCLCIVPALALDKEGNRLGRGKGFYDKFLHKQFHTSVASKGFFEKLFQIDDDKKTISVVPDFAFLDSIPTEPHDVRISIPISCQPI